MLDKSKSNRGKIMLQFPSNVPNHIAIVLDGNRRWATSKRMEPWEGHRAGGKKFEEFLDWCIEAGVKTISAYVLSAENLTRSRTELNKLFDIMCDFINKWLQPGGLIDKHEVKVSFIGKLDRLPMRLLSLIKKMTLKTAKYSKRFLNVMIAYSGKDEIASAVQNILKNFAKYGRIRVTPKTIEKNLAVKDQVDLVIRTGGHSRLSNFLLWQTAYAEMYTTKTFWPDFSKREFAKALNFFASTQRNFGS